jgi:hypothetical protein
MDWLNSASKQLGLALAIEFNKNQRGISKHQVAPIDRPQLGGGDRSLIRSPCFGDFNT